MAAWDWRLTMVELQEKHAYFTRLKASIERLHAQNGNKVNISCHVKLEWPWV